MPLWNRLHSVRQSLLPASRLRGRVAPVMRGDRRGAPDEPQQSDRWGRFMKMIGRMAMLMAGASFLAYASAAQAGTVRVTIAEYSKGTGPYFEEAAKAFEAANPGTTIQIEVVPWDNLQQKLTTDISAGTNADLSIIGTRWLLDYVSQDVVAPLDEYMTPEIKGRFIETFL